MGGCFSNCVSIKCYDGSYKGNSAYLNGSFVKHGFGVFVYNNKFMYEGEWMEGLKHGKGIFRYYGKKKFTGKWKNGKFWDGEGFLLLSEMYNKNADYIFSDHLSNNRKKYDVMYDNSFEGTIKDGKFWDGIENIKLMNQNVYEYKWTNGIEDACVKISFANKNKYEGEVQNGLPHGRGKMKYKDGCVCDGEWENGENKGIAKLIYLNGSIYEGEIENYEGESHKMSKRHGNGKFISFYDEIFVGEWKNDLPWTGFGFYKYSEDMYFSGEIKCGGYWTGEGKITYANGNRCEGKWNINVFEGKMIYKNGDIFEGRYENGNLCEGKMIYKNGNIFVGEWENGNLCDGKMIYTHGDIYEGTYVNNVKEGYGKMIYKNGDVYLGMWKNNMRDGHGKMTYMNGNIYDGEWKYNDRYGKCKFVSSENNIFYGEWRYNFPWDGAGTFKHSDETNNTYAGIFKNGELIEGNIKIKRINGTSYEGGWVDRKKNGFGIDNDGKGNIIKSIWINDIYNGYTEVKESNGTVYEGLCENGKANGMGIKKYSNGDIYYGEWKNDLFDGYGRMMYANGDIYAGSWKNGKINGDGVLVCGKSSISLGVWSNESKKFSGTTVYGDKTLFSGFTQDGLNHGFGSNLLSDGTKYKGEWMEGMMHGHGIYRYPDGSTYEGTFDNGKRCDNGTMYYSNGLCYIGKWKNDKKHGNGELKKLNFQSTDENIDGICEFNGIFEDDKCKTGMGVISDAQNDIIYSGNIVNFKYHGKGILRIKNKIIECNFINGIGDGIGTISESGTIYYGKIINGKRHGYASLRNGVELNKGIWERDNCLIMFKKTKPLKDKKCCICYEEFGLDLLFPLCDNEKCDSYACYNCIESYYKKIKKGCYLSFQNFSCFVCRSMISSLILRFMIKDLFELINLTYLLTNVKDTKFGWCDECNLIKKINPGLCVNNDGPEIYVCDDCSSIKYLANTKKCPHCGAATSRSNSKSDGCHHMTCKLCKKYWCWFCLAKLEAKHSWKCAKNGCTNPDCI